MSDRNIVLEHKKEFRRLMELIWSLYDKVPKEGKEEAQRLIDDWFNDRITYDQLIRELEKLTLRSGGKSE